MISEKTINYVFDKPFLKIFQFLPAHDDSVVFIAQTEAGKDTLFHYNKHSKLQYKVEFNDFVFGLASINNKEFIIAKVQLNQFWHINIEKHEVIKYRHKFQSDVGCQVYFEYFCESNLLCIRENGDHDNPKMYLTYYSYPLKSKGIYQHCRTEGQDQEKFIEQVDKKLQENINLIDPIAASDGIITWNPARVVRKVNPRSRYVWGDSKQKDQIVVYYAEVVGNQVLTNTLKINIRSLYQPYNMSTMEIAIIQLWQFRRDEFIMYTATTKNDKNAINPNTNVINNTFLWDLDKMTIRESKFAFHPKFHNNQIDIVGTPYFSMFRTFHFEPGAVKESPAYFVINQEQKIIKEETWKCSHVQKYVVPDNMIDTIAEGSFENGNVSKLDLRTIKIFFRAEMSLYLLLNMHGKEESIDDWDFDLLAEIIDVLDYE